MITIIGGSDDDDDGEEEEEEPSRAPMTVTAALPLNCAFLLLALG
jgi:hypothetical protein